MSGTNPTLVVGFLLLLARWAGVRGRWLTASVRPGIVGFVLLARTEPSVLRAAVMGTVGLFAMGVDGRRRGSRALGVAVVVLILVQPGLATLRVHANRAGDGGIVLLAPTWRDALACWLPRWAAEAVGWCRRPRSWRAPGRRRDLRQVSLTPSPPTSRRRRRWVRRRCWPGGRPGRALWPAAGRVLGTLAGWCVAWIVEVATRTADLPTAAIGWGPARSRSRCWTVLVAGVVGSVRSAAPADHRAGVLRSAGRGAAGAVAVAGLAARGWVLVACDVGQGDALVLPAGPHAAVIVDAGPDPTAVDACLDGLGVRSVPLLVLTHFHADHVDGVGA